MKQIKYIIIAMFAMMLCFSSIAYSAERPMTSEEAKAFYKEAYEHTILNNHATKEDYAQYYAKDFTMYENGKLYNFDEFVQLALERQKDTASIQIIFKDMVAESDGVATVHTTHVMKKDGSKLDLDVLSFFRLRNHQFASGNELTRLIIEQAGRLGFAEITPKLQAGLVFLGEAHHFRSEQSLWATVSDNLAAAQKNLLGVIREDTNRTKS